MVKLWLIFRIVVTLFGLPSIHRLVMSKQGDARH